MEITCENIHHLYQIRTRHWNNKFLLEHRSCVEECPQSQFVKIAHHKIPVSITTEREFLVRFLDVYKIVDWKIKRNKK